jgi:hypothetical protein
MNPFVNPRKRSISLPSGCKDLADVLRRTDDGSSDPIKTFICLVLMQAAEHRATELVIGVAPAQGVDSAARERVDGTWFHVSAFPSDFRARLVAELGRMACLPEGQFPSEGTLCVRLESRQLKWIVQIASPDAECVLTPLPD